MNNNVNGSRSFDPSKAAAAAVKAYSVVQLFLPLIKEVIGDATSMYRNLEAYKIDKVIDVPFLKVYKKKNSSEIMLARVGSLMNNMEDSELKREMSRLSEEYVIAEYDKLNERVVQSDFIRRENIADNIMTAINSNEGILFVRDK